MEKYKSLRDSVVFQLKFDFGILLVFGAIVSYLNLERNEISQTTNEVKYFIIAIAILIVYGLILERILALFLTDPKDTVEEKKDLKIINKMMWAQILLNICLVSGMTTYSFGWLESHITYKNNTELTNYLITKVQSYMTAQGCLPKNDEELLEFDSTIVYEMIRLDITEFKIVPTKDLINETYLNAQL